MPFSSAIEMFQTLAIKMLPLYAVMGLGFLFGRKRPEAGEAISFLQIYMIAPTVIASLISDLHFQMRYLILPLPVFVLCCAVAYGYLALARPVVGDRLAHIFSLGSASANTGYFGLPIAFLLFSANQVGVYVIIIVGMTVFEATVGYYLLMRGHYSIRESWQKLLRFPLIYGVLVGCVLSAGSISIPELVPNTMRDFRGVYVVLGSLMIGMGLSRLQHYRLDWPLFATVFSGKFILWPVLALLFVTMDRLFFRIFSVEEHTMYMLVSIMPLPANLIAYTLQLRAEPDKASTLVFLSTVFALFYVPLMVVLWRQY